MVKLAPSALLVFPLVETANLGSNFRFAQFVTWKELDTFALIPSALASVPVSAVLLQLVGLNVNPWTVDPHVHRP